MNNTLAIKTTDIVNGRRRTVMLECPTCHQQWYVRNRGRETGFIVSAANNHAERCEREHDEINLDV